MLRDAFGIKAKPTIELDDCYIISELNPDETPDTTWHPLLKGVTIALNFRDNINFLTCYLTLKDDATQEAFEECAKNPDYYFVDGDTGYVFIGDLSDDINYWFSDVEFENTLFFRPILSDGPYPNTEGYALTPDKKFWRLSSVAEPYPRIYQRERSYCISNNRLYLKKKCKSFIRIFTPNSKLMEVNLC